MHIKVSISPASIIRNLSIGVIIFTIISTGIQISKYVFQHREEWMDMFNLDREMNFPTWYMALMIVFCAVLLRIIATGKRDRGDRYHRDWQLLSTIFFWLAIDEILSIHEILIIPEVSQALNLPWFLHSMWVIPGTIFVVWFVKRYWKFSRHLPPQSKKHFSCAAVIYVSGALIMEMIGSHLAESQGQQHLPYALVATAEETIEMIGIIVFIYGLLFYLRQFSQNIDLRIYINSRN